MFLLIRINNYSGPSVAKLRGDYKPIRDKLEAFQSERKADHGCLFKAGMCGRNFYGNKGWRCLYRNSDGQVCRVRWFDHISVAPETGNGLRLTSI